MADRRGRDGGFTLVEVVVSLAIAGILLGSIGIFVVNGTGLTRQQGRQQTAVQLALDGMERARTVRGAAVLDGRAVCSTNCPDAGATGAAPYVQGTYRYDAAGSGTTPLPVPSAPERVEVDGVAFARYFYVGRCWAAASGGVCADTSTHAPTVASPVPFYRVVVAVTWPQSSCGAAGCRYVTSALFAAGQVDPVFSA